MPSWIAVFRRSAHAVKESLSGSLRGSTNSSVRVLYHIALVSLSAWIAVFLPWMTEAFLAHRARLQNQTEFICYHRNSHRVLAHGVAELFVE